jgi:hypothetical protein
MAPPRAASLLAGAFLALAFATPASAYVCLNGDPCRAFPCYAGQGACFRVWFERPGVV